MQFYDSTASKYDIRHDNATTRHMRKIELQVLRQYSKGFVLDVGCGTGVYSDISENYAGIDPAKNMALIANKKSGKFFAVAKAEHLPFHDKSFDTVICMFTVLNLCDVFRAVREMRRVLKDGGILVVSVASVWDKKNYGFMDKIMGKHISETKNVRIEKEKLIFKLFAKKELVKLFEKEEFRLLEFRGVYRWQEPFWNKYKDFNFLQKIKLGIEVFLPAGTGRIYIAVFRKQ
jgi:ubiquinone/menaquinone biosynthesis C-methylase UbiE